MCAYYYYDAAPSSYALTLTVYIYLYIFFALYYSPVGRLWLCGGGGRIDCTKSPHSFPISIRIYCASTPRAFMNLTIFVGARRRRRIYTYITLFYSDLIKIPSANLAYEISRVRNLCVGRGGKTKKKKKRNAGGLYTYILYVYVYSARFV